MMPLPQMPVVVGGGSSFAAPNSRSSNVWGTMTRGALFDANGDQRVRIAIRADTALDRYELVLRRSVTVAWAAPSWTIDRFHLDSGAGSRFFGAFVRPGADNPLRVRAQLVQSHASLTAVGAFNTIVTPGTADTSNEWGFNANSAVGTIGINLEFGLADGQMLPFVLRCTLQALSG